MSSIMVFAAFSSLMLFSSAMVITRKNPVPAAVYLVLAMCCAAALYAQMGADFIAAIQILVYAGAIMVLFLFVIMLLNLEPDRVKGLQMGAVEAGMMLLTVAGFAVLSISLLRSGGAGVAQVPQMLEPISNTEAIGTALFVDYLWPFELASILILMAIVASVVVAKKPESATTKKN